jgi:outer membrane protein assembly factor BamB
MYIRLVLITGLLLLSHCSTIRAENEWPNWRGPNFNGALPEADPPIEWGPDKNIKWKVPIPGEGSASPIIWGDRIYLNTAIRTDRTGQPDMQGVPPGPSGGGRGGSPAAANVYQFAVIALDRATGDRIWQTVVMEAVPHEQGHETNTRASGSPVTDGQHIFTSFGSFGVYCLDWDGNIVWKADLGKMTTRNNFGEGSSPALYKDTLVVAWDQDGYQDKNGNGRRDDDELLSSIVALDARTGAIKWRTPRPTEVTTWATPLVVEHKGTAQVITNGSTVRSYDIRDGKLLWECGGQVSNPIPSPLPLGDSVICMTGYRGNAIYSMQLDSRGAIDGTNKINWSRNDAAPYVASATLYKGQLYLTKERTGIMTSVDAQTGEIVIPQTRLTGINDVYASPIAAGDRIYFTGRNGVTTVLQHGSEYKELAVNKLGEPVDASPAIAGDELFIRAAHHLYCISKQ